MGWGGIVVTLAASWFLAGLSWTVQLVVYPAFTLVGGNEWPAYHAAHTRRILPAVGPAWLLEGVGVAVWLAAAPAGTRPLAFIAGIATAVTVGLTAVAAVPAHAALRAGYRERIGRRLERAHAARTMAWLTAAIAATLGAVIAHPR